MKTLFNKFLILIGLKAKPQARPEPTYTEDECREIIRFLREQHTKQSKRVDECFLGVAREAVERQTTAKRLDDILTTIEEVASDLKDAQQMCDNADTRIDDIESNEYVPRDEAHDIAGEVARDEFPAQFEEEFPIHFADACNTDSFRQRIEAILADWYATKTTKKAKAKKKTKKAKK